MIQTAWSLALALIPFAAPDAARIDSLAPDALKAWNVPGVAILIVSPEDVLHLKGYGNRELNGKPVTPDTVFPLASCSKAFTTALVSILADERQLSWDDPVRKHLPTFQLSDPAANALVTLRDLAAHRTGLAPHDLLWYRVPWSQEEMVRRAGKLPLTRPFRTEMQYQSIMYIALGQAAAAASGKPWAELVTERLLKPLGMSGVTLTTTEALKSPDHASGHRAGKDGKLAVIPWYEQPVPNPSGSVGCSARDLAPWLRLHLNGGKHRGEVLVSEAGLRETHSPQTIVRVEGTTKELNPDTHQISYGLGWVVQDYRGHLIVHHAGLIDGFRVHLTLLPKDGYAFAILANREGTRMNLALSNSLVDLMLGLPAKDWNKHVLGVMAAEELDAKIRAKRIELGRRPGELSTVPLEKLAGTYEEPAYGTVTVRVVKDALVWEWGSWKLPLDHFANDMFRLVEPNHSPLDGVFVHFAVEDGVVKGFRAADMVFRRAKN
jgi:CubicO group peptidase (beta-lactamase class C family)